VVLRASPAAPHRRWGFGAGRLEGALSRASIDTLLLGFLPLGRRGQPAAAGDIDARIGPRRSVSDVEVTVLCLGGPSHYAGKTFANVDPGNAGYFRFQGSVVGGPSAWYRIDYEAVPVTTEHGPAQPANYVGEWLLPDGGPAASR
jgi:hypothetical protein